MDLQLILILWFKYKYKYKCSVSDRLLFAYVTEEWIYNNNRKQTCNEQG